MELAVRISQCCRIAVCSIRELRRLDHRRRSLVRTVGVLAVEHVEQASVREVLGDDEAAIVFHTRSEALKHLSYAQDAQESHFIEHLLFAHQLAVIFFDCNFLSLPFALEHVCTYPSANLFSPFCGNNMESVPQCPVVKHLSPRT